MADEQQSAKNAAENKRKLEEHLAKLQAHGGKPPPGPEPEAGESAGGRKKAAQKPPKPPPRPPGWEAWKRAHGSRMHTLRPGEKEQLANEADYRILELTPKATPEEVRKAFNRLAKTYHPDMGGDPEIFQAMLAAYRRLTGGG